MNFVAETHSYQKVHDGTYYDVDYRAIDHTGHMLHFTAQIFEPLSPKLKGRTVTKVYDIY